MGHNESSAKRKTHRSECHEKETRENIYYLTAHLKALEQKEENTSKWNQWQEIIKLRAEINLVETKRTIQRTNKTKRWFF